VEVGQRVSSWRSCLRFRAVGLPKLLGSWTGDGACCLYIVEQQSHRYAALIVGGTRPDLTREPIARVTPDARHMSWVGARPDLGDQVIYGCHHIARAWGRFCKVGASLSSPRIFHPHYTIVHDTSLHDTASSLSSPSSDYQSHAKHHTSQSNPNRRRTLNLPHQPSSRVGRTASTRTTSTARARARWR
jgi:hypothetical protein